jgi:tetratricopeptide (TPR) repeat protein
VENGAGIGILSKQKLISAYTPSNMDPMLLKRIFVQRERLLDRIVLRLSASMTTGDKHHILLVGPRGSGKTHMVTLAVWELQQNPILSDTMRIAWLGEDDIFSGLIHLAFAIAKSLADEYPNEFPADFKSKVRGLPNDDAALAVLNSVIKNLQHRHLLLITENLDQTFNSLGEMGQKKLRAFLQETRRIATLATTQQLFAAVSNRKEAFFGFFDTQHLEPLTVDDAQQLIRKIAVEQQKTDLIQFLNSNHARYRIRALHHLAGGNYRMYVLLAEFLTRESLDDLVAAFETLAEEMTPYFQERMRSLPDQQRQLVQCLCDAEGALTVKEIAEETFIADGNCSKQLSHLKAKGYVRSEKRGKESYYDMAEPLMRLSLEVKNQRGRPLRLVTRFLKAWFPEEKLHSSLKLVGNDSRSAEYCKVALQCDNSFETIINSKLKGEIDQSMDAGDFHQALTLAEELSASDQIEGLFCRASASRQIFDWKSVQAALTEIINITGIPATHKATALINRGVAHDQLDDTQSALEDYTAVIGMSDAPDDKKVKAFFNRGATYGQVGDAPAALADYTSLIGMPDASSDQKASALVNRSVAYGRLGDAQAALADCAIVIGMPDAPSYQKANALNNRGMAYGQMGDTQSELAAYTAMIEMPDTPSNQKATALVNRGLAYARSGRTCAALADYTVVIGMSDAYDDHKARALICRGLAYCQSGDTQAALTDYTVVIEAPDAPGDQKARALVYRGLAYTQLGDMQAALADYTAVTEMFDAPGDQKAIALVYRGLAYWQLGDVQAALADCAAVIEMPDAPTNQKATAFVLRGLAYGPLGNTQVALADFTAVTEMFDAPGDQKATALVYRGMIHRQSRSWQASYDDFDAALTMPDASPEVRTKAMFALIEPMIAIRSLQQVVSALELAFKDGDKQSDDYGGTPRDLLLMIINRGPLEWAVYASAIAPLYVQFGVAEKLGRGVTQSIQFLDEGDFSASQLELWNQAWQNAGKDCEDLQIPLACLDAAVEILKSDVPTDRPLFRLPLEVRQLVRPLLRKTLPED